MGSFEFLNRRPLEKGDDERIRSLLTPMNADGRFFVQRCLRPDGSPQIVRVIDIRDRRTDQKDQYTEEIRFVAGLLEKAGFDVRETSMSRSEWGDLEVHERS